MSTRTNPGSLLNIRNPINQDEAEVLLESLKALLKRYRADAGEECYYDDPAAIDARNVIKSIEGR